MYRLYFFYEVFCYFFFFFSFSFTSYLISRHYHSPRVPFISYFCILFHHLRGTPLRLLCFLSKWYHPIACIMFVIFLSSDVNGWRNATEISAFICAFNTWMGHFYLVFTRSDVKMCLFLVYLRWALCILICDCLD